MYEGGNSYTRRGVLKKGVLATGAFVLGSAASGTASAGIGDGRVGHYNLNNLHLNKDTDEKIKNFVHDASTYKNHGMNYGASVVKDGAVGKAFDFSSGDFVQINDDESLELTSAVTVAAWVWRDGSKDLEYIYDGRGHNYLIKERDGTEKPEFYVRIDGDWSTVTASDPLPNNTWTHVAGTYDSSRDSKSLRLYINGVLDHSKDVNGDIQTSRTATDLFTSRIGDTVWNVNDRDDVGGYSFQGRIDEVRIYNRALSSSEITELATMDEE